MTYLHKRGYNRGFLRQEITRAKSITRNEEFYAKIVSPPLWINLNAFHLYLPTTQLSAPSHPSLIREHFSILT